MPGRQRLARDSEIQITPPQDVKCDVFSDKWAAPAAVRQDPKGGRSEVTGEGGSRGDRVGDGSR